MAIVFESSTGPKDPWSLMMAMKMAIIRADRERAARRAYERDGADVERWENEGGPARNEDA